MVATSTRSAVKVIGAKGQTVLPDNERWLHESKAAADLERALAWATANPPDDANTEQLLEKLADGQE